MPAARLCAGRWQALGPCRVCRPALGGSVPLRRAGPVVPPGQMAGRPSFTGSCRPAVPGTRPGPGACLPGQLASCAAGQPWERCQRNGRVQLASPPGPVTPHHPRADLAACPVACAAGLGASPACRLLRTAHLRYRGHAEGPVHLGKMHGPSALSWLVLGPAACARPDMRGKEIIVQLAGQRAVLGGSKSGEHHVVPSLSVGHSSRSDALLIGYSLTC